MSNNPFATEEMAAGYATSRPPVHPLVVEQAWCAMDLPRPVRRALDVGCGAGASTKALAGFAEQCIGLEPAAAMLRLAPRIAPDAAFAVGAAEHIPIRNRSIDVMTAAGSLNYVNLDLFFPEAVRVLAPQGVLIAYDFSAGKSFRNTTDLDDWFSRFTNRYPMPVKEARELNPEILRRLGLRVRHSQQFEIGIVLSRAFYLDYMMTETNVASAVRGGTPNSNIRSWCAETLSEAWGDEDREVLFRGYFACV